MGLELKTTANKGKAEFLGKLHLDSKRLAFSGKEFKWSVELGSNVNATAKGTQLIVTKGRERVVFEIGDRPERWVEKILNPPSRMDKLGVKADMRCWVSKGFGIAFKTELKDRGAKVVRQLASCDLAFFSIAHRDNFGDLFQAVDELSDKKNIWVVYPKGSDSITQGDVMKEMKKLGFGPSKTAAFDEGLSSMRYARRN